MGLSLKMPEYQGYFADLQQSMVNVIALFAMAVGYVWLAANIWAVYLGRLSYESVPSFFSWAGGGLLLTTAIASWVLRNKHLHPSTYLLAWSILGATSCAAVGLSIPPSAVAYLFILPILFASVLLSRSSFWLVAAVAHLLAIGLSMIHFRLPGSMLSMAILVLVTLTSWLSTRRLYVALEWVWSGYEQANHNEAVARDRQAELQRTLKALDEASYRLERANYMLMLARDQADEARRLKQQFAQTISHELRTPLNLIVGFSELMVQSPEHYGGRIPASYSRDLRIVYRNALHLQTLVNDVLDLARLEAAQLGLVPEETAPNALVKDAINTVRSLVEARGLGLRTHIQPGLPNLWIDPTRIRQVLFNLLNNAVRFTETGSVTVSAVRDGEQIVFSVADTGVGVPPEYIDRIFEEFQQADGSTKRRHGGIGLGLAISKRFVILHGGRIWVDSQPGKGSTFYFSLPIRRGEWEPAPAGRLAEAGAPPPGTETEKPVLLVVTRSIAAATLLTRYVQGCQTVVVPDVAQACSTAQQLLPQAVVIDPACDLPEGKDLAALARDWGLPRTPFMICPLPGNESAHQQMDVNGYLVKPVSRQSLWDVLRQFGESVDRVLVVDDDDDFVQLIERMLDSPVRRYQVMSAYSGQEGLTLMRHRRPDLVLLDLQLPDGPGTEVVKEIRAHAEWQQIPIVIISARDEPESEEPAAGAITVAKASPLRPAEVVRWVQHMVNAAVTTPTEPTGSTKASPP